MTKDLTKADVFRECLSKIAKGDRRDVNQEWQEWQKKFNISFHSEFPPRNYHDIIRRLIISSADAGDTGWLLASGPTQSSVLMEAIRVPYEVLAKDKGDLLQHKKWKLRIADAINSCMTTVTQSLKSADMRAEIVHTGTPENNLIRAAAHTGLPQILARTVELYGTYNNKDEIIPHLTSALPDIVRLGHEDLLERLLDNCPPEVIRNYLDQDSGGLLKTALRADNEPALFITGTLYRDAYRANATSEAKDAIDIITSSYDPDPIDPATSYKSIDTFLTGVQKGFTARPSHSHVVASSTSQDTVQTARY